MNPEPKHGPNSGRRWLRLAAGPLLTLAWAAGLGALRQTPLYVPGLGASLLVVVAWATFTGGLLPGLISAAIALGAALQFYYVSAPGLSAEDVRHIIDLGVASVLIVAMLGVLRRRAERAHRLAAEAAIAAEYRDVFEEAADPILLADPGGRYVFVNRRACEMSGYSREELLRMRVGELFLQDPNAPDRMERAGSEGASRTHVEVDLVRRDGTRLRAELSVRRLGDGRTLKIVRDVTEQRAAVDRLQAALSLVRATLESTTDGILVVDDQGKWVGVNDRFREMWRIPGEIEREGLDGRALDHVLEQLADPDVFIARVRELYASPGVSSHDQVVMKDGRILERYSIPQRIGERTVGRVWSFRDVTLARRQAEALHETEQRFIQTEKLDAVGRLAGGVAHDFNNMLTAILGEADLLLLQAPLDERSRLQVENIRSAGLRSARLTRQLLEFARRQYTKPQPFPLRELLTGLEPLIRRLAGRAVDVRLDLQTAGAGAWVYADPAQFEQALLNLVINAGDAMPGGGSLVLSLCLDDVGEADAGRRGAPAAGRYACVCVSDTGTGIPEDVRAHLFEPFFTTKPSGKGTGLGLASVHGVVQQANGFVEVQTEVGAGTMFRVLLPEYVRARVETPPEERKPLAPKPPQATSVLVVDDEQHVRGIVVAVLTHAGYDVLQADSAPAAMQLARAQPAPIDLLLSDVVMPDTSGPALARTLIGEGRARRVMFMSGYPGSALAGDLGDLEGVSVVSKPFRSHELLEQVRLALEGAEMTPPR